MPGTNTLKERSELALIGGLTALGALVRIVYLAFVEGLPPYDPWRHLVLLRNLREGLGFTLFDGQTYIFYQPPWYLLCNLLPHALRPEWIATALSIACVPLVYLLLRQEGASRFGATAGGILVAGYGPLVRYTCHAGSEAFAMALMLGAFVLLRARKDLVGDFVSGLLFGIALLVRMNFVFAGMLLLPALTRPRRAVALGVGAFVPLAIGWWRNHSIIAAHEYLFAWDGVAAAAREFNPLSTLVIQMHPTVREGLSRLHAQLAPEAEWLVLGPTMLFMFCVVICVMFSRHVGIAISFAVAFVYFLFFDATATAHFYRIWAGLFPLMLMAIALAAGRCRESSRGPVRLLGPAVVGLALLLGASDLRPPAVFPVEMVTPPRELLADERYMVNGTFFHPESLIHRFPEKRFIGLPIEPREFPAFQSQYPEYRSILWHDISVQEELLAWLLSEGGYEVVATASNRFGRRYQVLRPIVTDVARAD